MKTMQFVLHVVFQKSTVIIKIIHVLQKQEWMTEFEVAFAQASGYKHGNHNSYDVNSSTVVPATKDPLI